jgi:hypothetical protein
MELKMYLKKEQLTQHLFIEKIESSFNTIIPQGTLAKWITGTRIPRKKEMLILHKITKGLVQPNDFYLGGIR